MAQGPRSQFGEWVDSKLKTINEIEQLVAMLQMLAGLLIPFYKKVNFVIRQRQRQRPV